MSRGPRPELGGGLGIFSAVLPEDPFQTFKEYREKIQDPTIIPEEFAILYMQLTIIINGGLAPNIISD